MQALSAEPLVAVSSLREFFRDAFHTASEHQHLDIDEQAEQYVVNLLTMFSRADALYEKTPDGLRIRPLAHMLAVLNDPTAAANRRDKMAIAAAPYVHGRIAEKGKKAVEAEAARDAGEGSEWAGDLDPNNWQQH